jgi:hypothetical protein
MDGEKCEENVQLQNTSTVGILFGIKEVKLK